MIEGVEKYKEEAGKFKDSMKERLHLQKFDKTQVREEKE